MKKISFIYLGMILISLACFTISCMHDAPVNNNNCIQLSYTATGDTTNNHSADGTITAVATGGTIIQYSLNNGTPQQSGFFSGLLGGQTYTLNVTNAEGCSNQVTVNIDTIHGVGIINDPCASFSLNANSVNPTIANISSGSITALVSGGAAPYTFSINTTPTQTNQTGSFTGLRSGTYTLSATWDNCTKTKSITLIDSISFSRDIQPIIVANCGNNQISCHNHSNNWTTYDDIAFGTAGTPWPTHLKTLIGRLRGTTALQSSGSHNMPPSSSALPTGWATSKFTLWVNQGFHNN